MYQYHNPNPENHTVIDCVIRAISVLIDNPSWEEVYIDVATEGLLMHDMPSSNRVWGSYLERKGFRRTPLNYSSNDYHTVSNFCKEYPNGRYLLELDGHVVSVVDGNYYDIWDSGQEIVLSYWKERK